MNANGHPETLIPGGNGRGGRPKGSRDKVPRTLKASIRHVYEQIVRNEPELVENAIRDGLKAKPPASFPYLQLAAHYLDGKPAKQVEVTEVQPMRVIFRWQSGDDTSAGPPPSSSLPSRLGNQ